MYIILQITGCWAIEYNINYFIRVQQARNETETYKQTVSQKDVEISQLKQNAERLEHELQVRAGRLKDHEQTIQELQQRTQAFQQKFKDADSARERLEEEVNKANKMVMGNRNSTELGRAEVRLTILSSCLFLILCRDIYRL